MELAISPGPSTSRHPRNPRSLLNPLSTTNLRHLSTQTNGSLYTTRSQKLQLVLPVPPAARTAKLRKAMPARNQLVVQERERVERDESRPMSSLQSQGSPLLWERYYIDLKWLGKNPHHDDPWKTFLAFQAQLPCSVRCCPLIDSTYTQVLEDQGMLKSNVHFGRFHPLGVASARFSRG